MKIAIFSKETGGRLKYVFFRLFPMGNYEVITFVTIIIKKIIMKILKIFKESEWSVKILQF